MLTDLQAKTFKDGRHGDVPNLFLNVRNKGTSRTWVFRFVSPVTGKRRDMGIGSYPTVSLAEAREKAILLGKKVKSGIDPIIDKAEKAKEKEIAKSHLKMQ